MITKYCGGKISRTTCSLFVILCLTLSGLFSLPALAENQVFKAPQEGWVEILPVPTADPKLNGQVKSGISYLLSESQTRHRPDGSEFFSRDIYQIVDRTGLDSGASISLQFDPATQKLTVNRLNIIRDGIVIDRLSASKFDVARREQDAEKGIFDGWLTAYINIDDVRVGDIVDYATTTIRTPLVGRDLFFERMNVEWYRPVSRMRLKIVWPSDKPLITRQERTTIPTTSETRDGQTTYIADAINPLPVPEENNLPSDYPNYGAVEISSVSNWQQIVDAVLPYYALDQQLPAEFAAKLDEISKKWSKPEDRMVEAMRLVQDNIRYVSLSIGGGSYIPRSPSDVVASGFGDCKDKSLLLAASLKRLGVEANVALTDLDQGLSLVNSLPTLRAFDHVIVKANVSGKVYWLDATDYLQGGRAENLTIPDYGYALPIIEKTAILEKIETPALLQATTSVNEAFDFPGKTGDPLYLTVTTIYRDRNADRMRYRLINNSLATLAKDYLEYYNRSYPGIKATIPLQTKDDRDRNVLVVTEYYNLPAEALAADKLIENFPLKADIGINDLPEPSSLNRQRPVSLGRTKFSHHRIWVTNLKAAFAGPEDYANIITPYTAFRMDWSNTPTTFKIDWYFNKMVDRVPATDISRYLKSVSKMKENSSWTYNFAYTETTSN